MLIAAKDKPQEVKNIVAEFIRETYLFGCDDCRPGEDDSMMAQGIVDSTGILELAAFLELKFNVTIRDEEFVPENLDTLNNICAYILRKVDGRHPGCG